MMAGAALNPSLLDHADGPVEDPEESRFMDRPIASQVRAQKLFNVLLAAIAVGLTPPSAAAASGAGQAAGVAPPRFSSVCVRDVENINNAMVQSGLLQYGTSNDRWLLQLNDVAAQIYQRCASYDPRAAEEARRATQEAARIRSHCARAHPVYDCTPWGYSYQDDNRRYFTRWEQEARRALSDPDYSARLGTAAGTGGAAAAASPAPPPGVAAAPAAARGPDVQGESPLDMRTLRERADRGDARAQFQLGDRYLAERNFDEALRWWRSSADQGDASGQYLLGLLHEQGLGVPQDDEEALRWLRLALQQLPEEEVRLAVARVEQRLQGTNRTGAVEGSVDRNLNDESRCITPDVSGPGAAWFANSCNYPVYVLFCNLDAREDSGSSSFDCRTGKFGLSGVPANGRVAALIVSGRPYWSACQQPATPRNAVFELGRGIIAQCR